MKRSYTLLLLLTLIGVGCIKKNDLNLKNITVDNWKPDWALPILNSKLTLKNIIKTGTTITENTAGLYSLHYDSKLFSARASDYIQVPDQNYNTPNVTLSIPQTNASFSGSISDSFASSFNYNDTSGAQLAHIGLKGGNIHLSFITSFHQNVSIQFVFPNITNAGNPLVLTAGVNYPATTGTADASLAGYTVDLTNNNTTKNYLAYKIRYTLTGTGQPLAPSDNLSVNVAMTSLQYSFLDGFLGHYYIPIPSDTINVSVFNNTLTADIYLRNPKINLSFTNSFGLSVKASFDSLYGLTNKGGYVNMNLSPITVNSSGSLGATAVTNFTVDSTNSSIQNMFNPAPNKVIYNGILALNPGGSTTYNFVTDTSTISMTADAELPAWFSIIDFSLQDTQKLVLPQDTSLLDKAEFKMLMDNAFPLYGAIQIYFADSAYNMLDSLMPSTSDIIAQAPVDANGIVNGRTQQITNFTMTHDHYNAMAAKVRYALIRGDLKSSGNKDIQIHSSDNIIVKLAFRFTLNVSQQNL